MIKLLDLKFRSKYGFTLAETLITLGIIGVVSAITIPSLISNYKKKYTVNRLKQVYSILSNATQLAISEKGLEPEDWLSEDIKSLSEADKKEYLYNNYIKPYINTLDYNKSEGSFYDATGAKYSFVVAPWESKLWLAEGPYHLLGSIMVDLDGDKGKNISGYDRFYFLYAPKKSRFFYWQGKVFDLLPCGNNGKPEQLYLTTSWPGCHSSIANCCGDVIRKEGWQIKEKYPIKF